MTEKISKWLCILVLSVFKIELIVLGCPEEVPRNGISVTWHNSTTGENIESDPLCYGNDGNLITRSCNDTEWQPPINSLKPCMKVMEYFDLNSCPPGYYKFSENNTGYCYQIGTPSEWNYPCFKSGGASVITDLTDSEIISLISSLTSLHPSRYFWLPAQRLKQFHPLMWVIPGPNWGRVVERAGTAINIQDSIFRNCLLLDVRNRNLLTDNCDKVYPSLCFYINDIHYPAMCPDGYYPFRFMLNEGTCFGIEHTENIFGLTFNDFLKNKCPRPMGDSKINGLARFVFKKMADLDMLPDNQWCWFESSYAHNGSHVKPREQYENYSNIATEVLIASLEGIINNAGTLSLMNTMSQLPCMACEAEMFYRDTELMFEYNNIEQKMYLTIYFPSGLWKYQRTDKGIQCFSNAKGFVNVIDINDTPFLSVNEDVSYANSSDLNIDKIVYEIDPITDRSAQYWCEGHTQNFTFIGTKRIVVNPGNKEHVFALVIKMTTTSVDGEEQLPDFSKVVNNITDIFGAKKVILMDFLEFTNSEITILVHIHICIGDNFEDEANALVSTLADMKKTALDEFPTIHVTLVNISSSIYCLPTTSKDIITLNWELTHIGQITAPKQFCLQSNGLPVKRLCGGSYLLGAIWKPIDGVCSKNYEATYTTTFLYNIAKGKCTYNCSTRFLTEGLSYVLDDVDIIIPADIFYLSMSFQFIIDTAERNQSLVETGDLNNIAWVMNRVMYLDQSYLRLSQTLNSTNVIVDSINDIIEMIARRNEMYDCPLENKYYQLAVEPQFVAQISYPAHNNITGIALTNPTQSDDFRDMKIIPLYYDTILDDILSIENLEVATWVPAEVLDTLRKNKNWTTIDNENSTAKGTDFHVVINVFYNDAVFQEIDFRKHILNSRIIGISIPGYISNLEHSIPIIFRELNTSNARKCCSYWDFHEDLSSTTPGYWANDGCFFADYVNNLTLCKCYHLTNFGQLVSIDRDVYPEKSIIRHTKALNAITLVGCFLSLLGIAGIWLTAIVFHSWRKKPGTKVLLHLSTAISLPLIFILLFNLDISLFIKENGIYLVDENKIGLCITLGASLHYSILAGFMWMLITAILQFIRYVRVLGVSRPSRFMIKFTLIGWGTPILPVMAILIVDPDNYLPKPAVVSFNAYNRPICYPTGNLFIYTVIIPIMCILIVNVTLFGLVMYSISRGPDGKMRSTDLDIIGAQLRLSIFLFFLLGLTWFFGIFSFSSNIICSYLFCLTSTLQGFVLFIYFVICDPATRTLWVTLMKPQFLTSSSRESVANFN